MVHDYGDSFVGADTQEAFGMKARSSMIANLFAPGRYKPISNPPLAATENLRNSRRSIWRGLIWRLPWKSCWQPGGSPCGSADKCHSDGCYLSLPGRCLHRLGAAFRAAVPPRSSV